MADYNLERLNVLIVDDNRHMRSLVKLIVLALGIKNVVEAGDGADPRVEPIVPPIVIPYPIRRPCASLDPLFRLAIPSPSFI